MKKKGYKHDYAMDSTLISFQEYNDKDCSVKQVMFDRTFDDMSLLHEDRATSELLREKTANAPHRSRFISDDSIFSFRTNPSPTDVPDKQLMMEQEEYKYATPPPSQTMMIDTK